MPVVIAEKWPLDFDMLKKGDIIEESTCRGIIKTDDESRYQLGLLKLRERIVCELSKRGINATVKCHGKGIKILTDAEASVYNVERQKIALAQFFAGHTRLMQVDPSELTDEQKNQHDRRVNSSARYMSAIATTRQELRAIPTAKPERPKLG